MQYGKICPGRAKTRLVALFLCFCLALSHSFSFAQRPLFRSNGGPADPTAMAGGRVLSFSKGPGKRTVYSVGSPLKVKLIDGRKFSGRVSVVRDTDFYLSGQRITLDSVAAYYVPMRMCLLVGSALCIAGGGYIILDGFNGLINNKKPAFHKEALTVGLPIAAAGAVILPFKEVKRRTKVWRPQILELW